MMRAAQRAAQALVRQRQALKPEERIAKWKVVRGDTVRALGERGSLFRSAGATRMLMQACRPSRRARPGAGDAGRGQVQIMTGKDKGKQGEVIEVQRKHNRVVVAGLNLVRRWTATGRNGRGGNGARADAGARGAPTAGHRARGVRDLY